MVFSQKDEKNGPKPYTPSTDNEFFTIRSDVSNSSCGMSSELWNWFSTFNPAFLNNKETEKVL